MALLSFVYQPSLTGKSVYGSTTTYFTANISGKYSTASRSVYHIRSIIDTPSLYAESQNTGDFGYIYANITSWGLDDSRDYKQIYAYVTYHCGVSNVPGPAFPPDLNFSVTVTRNFSYYDHRIAACM